MYHCVTACTYSFWNVNEYAREYAFQIVANRTLLRRDGTRPKDFVVKVNTASEAAVVADKQSAVEEEKKDAVGSVCGLMIHDAGEAVAEPADKTGGEESGPEEDSDGGNETTPPRIRRSGRKARPVDYYAPTLQDILGRG